jgi:hypothetical protein
MKSNAGVLKRHLMSLLRIACRVRDMIIFSPFRMRDMRGNDRSVIHRSNSRGTQGHSGRNMLTKGQRRTLQPGRTLAVPFA